MRKLPREPAVQLGSVAARYQQRGRFWPGWKVPLLMKFSSDSRRVAVREPDGELRDERLARLEAVLFLAKEPLHPRKLCKFANLADGTEALTLVDHLNRLYDRAAQAFRVEEVAGGFQLRTRRKFAKWLRRLRHVPTELRLSAPSLETLAVVAYRQPVVRADIERVRGVGCGEVLRQLMDRDLVRVSGRSDELGRPYLYSTTNHFLQVFGLRQLDELPRADRFRQSGMSTRQEPQPPIPDETESVGNHEGDSEVTVSVATPRQDKKRRHRDQNRLVSARRLRAEDEDWEEEDEEFEDEEFEDEDEDWEDDEDEDDDADEIEDDEDDEEDEWEEVDDDEEDEDEDEDEEDEDWDDEDDEEFEDDDEEDDEDEDEEYEYLDEEGDEDEEIEEEEDLEEDWEDDEEDEWEEVDDEDVGEDEEEDEDEDWEENDEDEDWEEED